MTTKLDPEVDRLIRDLAERQMVELGVPTDPVGYDSWFRAKVQAAMDDPRPGIPHERAAERRKQREGHNDL